jgi:hypothetical protein
MGRLDWLWSNLFSTALDLAAGLIFIWAGMVFYILVQSRHLSSTSVRRVGRGLLLSTPVFLCIGGALAGAVMLLQLLAHVEMQQQPELSIAQDGPQFVRKQAIEVFEVTAVPGKHSKDVRVKTRVQEVPDPFWQSKFRVDHAVSANSLSPLGAITETGFLPAINRLPFFFSLVLALWTTQRAKVKSRELPGN